MSLDWDHQFCLGCDTQTDSSTYCSEACRLRDYMKTASLSSPSSLNSGASSPAPSGPSYEWTFNKPTTTSTRFYLSPAFDFGTPQTSRANSILLSPSASQISLCSMRSTSSAGLDSTQQSDKAARELRAYARSFESVRNQRRRSY